MYQKFIINQDGVLKFGRVYLHKDLLQPGEQCVFGGGLWKIDEGRRAILLYGRSFDFGPPYLGTCAASTGAVWVAGRCPCSSFPTGLPRTCWSRCTHGGEPATAPRRRICRKQKRGYQETDAATGCCCTFSDLRTSFARQDKAGAKGKPMRRLHHFLCRVPACLPTLSNKLNLQPIRSRFPDRCRTRRSYGGSCHDRQC